MADDPSERGLANFGIRLLNCGYSIVPIRPGKKRPAFENWQNLQATPALVGQWLANGLARGGVGIHTKWTPAVDLDITDDALVREMEEHVLSVAGFAPTRVGRAPKRLLLFSTSEPFPKVSSVVYIHPVTGLDQRVEILGDGQQFVAYAIHPDTHQPFTWTTKETPLNQTPLDLPTMKHGMALAIVAEFERRAEALGWQRKPKGAENLGRMDAEDRQPLMDDRKVDLSWPEFREAVLSIPHEALAAYEDWVNIGFSIWHQSDGSDDGLALWHEWSANHPNYKPHDLDKRWPGMNAERKGRPPMTGRFVLHHAKLKTAEIRAKLRTDSREDLLKGFTDAQDRAAFDAACAAVRAVETIDIATRGELEHAAREAFHRITRAKLLLSDVRKLLAPVPPELTTPEWLQGYTFIAHEGQFYQYDRDEESDKATFNHLHNHHLMTPGDQQHGRPQIDASDFAMNVIHIPVAHFKMYDPREKPRFRFQGHVCVNTFSATSFPRVPATIGGEAAQAVDTVFRHFDHLIANPRDRALFVSWLAWIVQTNSRPNWSVVLQGVQGDGKTWIGAMMRAVLGPRNVGIIGVSELTSGFTGWAAGHLLKVVEEIKIERDRYGTLNRLKEYVTNEIVSIHPKGVNPYHAVNTAAHLYLTNYANALPLDRQETRYMILTTRFQTKLDLDEFNFDHPDYYERLWAVARSPQHAGAVRKAFMEHKLAPDFSAARRAPMTTAKMTMVDLTETTEDQILREVLEAGEYPDLTAELFNLTRFNNLLTAEGVGRSGPRYVATLLHERGFVKAGRIRIEGALNRYYTRYPKLYVDARGTFTLHRLRAAAVAAYSKDPNAGAAPDEL